MTTERKTENTETKDQPPNVARWDGGVWNQNRWGHKTDSGNGQDGPPRLMKTTCQVKEVEPHNAS